MAVRVFLPAFALLLCAPAHGRDAADAEESSSYLKQASCTKGPLRLQLPKSYPALKRMAVLKREKILGEDDIGGRRAVARELRFVGAELVVYTSPDKPGQYRLARATFTTPRWRIMGPLRVGTSTSVALKGLGVKPVPRNGELTLEGDQDAILLTIAGGRVQEIDYECATE